MTEKLTKDRLAIHVDYLIHFATVSMLNGNENKQQKQKNEHRV